MVDRRSFQMPFRHWRDRDTANFERVQPEMADPERCFKLLSWKGPDGRNYLLNRKNRRYFSAQGPFKEPYIMLEDLEDLHSGRDAFVVCPGPSVESFDLRSISGCVTYAVNSAGFLFEPRHWVAAESNWLLWLKRERPDFPSGRRWIMSSRCAVRWRGLGMTNRVRKILVSRLEEERIMPHRQPAVALMAALFSAWWLGAQRCYLLGCDLSRPKGRPYARGAPHSAFGASNPFDEQLRAMEQFSIPGFEVINASPYSRDSLPFPSCSNADVEKAVSRDRSSLQEIAL